MIGTLISIVLSGLVIGALARLALPGRDPMSIPMTIGIGILGALVGGFIGYAIFGFGAGVFVLEVLVATGLVYLVRRSRESRRPV